MPELARQIRSRGARPGVWIRPLGAIPGTHASRLLPVARAQDNSAKVDVYDPSIEENLHQVESDFRTASQWGYELIKHDWTSCDVLGRWGFNMGHELTSDGWQFSDRSKTSAEIVLDLFRAIRRGAGASVVIGCNTFSHLSAGIFEIQRTGDDTSGREWERTRKMGPNTLAFRMPQHDAFYAVDADCVGLTDLVPWELNRQWLEVLSTSGTPLFVSTDPKAVTPERSAALKEAFAIAAQRQPISVPLDWMQTTCPHDWQVKDRTLQFDWNPAEPAL